MHGRTIVHFLVKECRPWIMNYFSWYALVLNNAVFYIGERPRRSGLEGMDFNKYRKCIYADAAWACFLPTQTIHGTCVDFETNHWGLLNLAVLILTTGMVANMLYHLVKLNCKYTSGDYISFTFKMQNQAWYKGLARAFVVFTVLSAFYVLYHGMMNPEYQWMFLVNQGPAIALSAYSSCTLTRAGDRVIAMGNDCFKALNFKRSWKDIFSRGNAELEVELERAILLAFNKNPAHLERLIDLDDSDLIGSNDERMERIVAALHPMRPERLSPAAQTTSIESTYVRCP